MEDDLWWRRPSLEDDLRWKTTFCERRHPVEGDILWKTTFGGKRPSLEDVLQWKTTFDGRPPLMKDNLWWKMTLNGRQLKSLLIKRFWYSTLPYTAREKNCPCNTSWLLSIFTILFGKDEGADWKRDEKDHLSATKNMKQFLQKKTIFGCLGLSQTILVYLGVSQATSGYISTSLDVSSILCFPFLGLFV